MFEPYRNRVSLRPLSLYDFDEIMNSLSFEFKPEKPVHVQLIVNGPVLELFLDYKRAMASNLYSYSNGGMALVARDGEVHFDSIRVKTQQ